ncbi:hypothetical protein D3C76_725520 [compost metagenome]
MESSYNTNFTPLFPSISRLITEILGPKDTITSSNLLNIKDSDFLYICLALYDKIKPLGF